MWSMRCQLMGWTLYIPLKLENVRPLIRPLPAIQKNAREGPGKLVGRLNWQGMFGGSPDIRKGGCRWATRED